MCRCQKKINSFSFTIKIMYQKIISTELIMNGADTICSLLFVQLHVVHINIIHIRTYIVVICQSRQPRYKLYICYRYIPIFGVLVCHANTFQYIHTYKISVCPVFIFVIVAFLKIQRKQVRKGNSNGVDQSIPYTTKYRQFITISVE